MKISIRNINRFIISLCFSLLLTDYTKSVLNIPYKLTTVFLILISAALFYCFISMMTKEFHVTDIIYWGLVIISCILYYWALRRPKIAYDTWQVYDMSRYIFKDFGYMRTIRQHIMNTHYEMSFPPLFPFLMAAINLFLDMGIMSSVLLNFIFLLALICLFKNTGDGTRQRVPFAIASITFICTSLFRVIFMGGLSQLLSFLFFAIIMRLILKQEFTKKDCFICAFVSGLGLMNRFDFLAITGIISLLIPFRVNQLVETKKRLIWILVNIIIVTLVCFPWILYSMIHFGKIFVTDNGRRLFNIVNTKPSTYFSVTHPALTIFDDSKAWFAAFKSRCMVAVEALGILIKNYYIFKCFVGITIGVGIIFLLYILIKKNINFKSIWITLRKNSAILIIACAIIGQEILFILTGYRETRYHILFLFLVNLWSLIQFNIMIQFGYKYIKCNYNNTIKKIILFLVLLLMFMTFINDGYRTLQINRNYILSKKLSGADTVSEEIFLSDEEARIDRYLYNEGAACLLIYRAEKNINIPRVCSLIRTTTMISPTNISIDNTAEFVRDFDIDYIYSTDMNFNDTFSNTVGLIKTPIEHLYMIEKISERP